MVDQSTDAERWDRGCETDEVRNSFVIPKIAQLLNSYQPLTILDVGAGTGYAARSIDSHLIYRPEWCLLDINDARLSFARDRCPNGMSVKTACDDFLKLSPLPMQYEAMMFGFTLLELGTGKDVLGQIDNLCARPGLLIISQPDVMQDVIAKGVRNPKLVADFVDAPVQLHKVDKFTQSEYPFQAERFESVTYKIMKLGFVLESFEKETFDGRAVFLLAFRRRP